MAERLTHWDAGFLHAEDANPHTNLGMGALMVLDGPVPDYPRLLSTLGERIAACPRFAQRVRRRLFDVAAPEWVDDIGFKLANHVQRVALPSPGSDEELFGVVAELMSWRLDRNRPLWEIWVIEGLRDGRWAMLTKVHPCIADAIATMHIVAGLSDNAAMHHLHGAAGADHSATAVTPVGQAPSPPRWASLVPDIVRASAETVNIAGQVLRGSVEIAENVFRAASSSLNGPLAGRRRYTAASVSLDDVHRICEAFGVGVNDVVLSALAEGYRDMLVRRGEDPHPEAVRTLVPVSVPGSRAAAGFANQLMLLPNLPVEEENPVVRLRMMRARMAALISAADRQSVGVVAAAARYLPFPVAAWTLDLLGRLPQRSVASLAVNVPGPGEPLQVMGCDVTQVLPIPPIAMQLRTGTATLSYAGRLHFGILADFDAVPDIDEFARSIEQAIRRLVASSRRRRKRRNRNGLSLVVNA